MAAVSPVPHVLSRPVLWALALAALIGTAAYAFLHIPVEVLPQFDFPEVSVVTHMPGTTATELESLLVYPLEGQILTLPDLESVRSAMGNGVVETNVRFRQGTSAALDLQAVNGAIDRARGQLPPAVHPLAQIMGNS
ncbi:MAG: efflux RND transporter permease subunit, partial [Gammaproteobacteria bacterium]|nr:efflux RND transporter permease subunit [Gammaproteobacteria bacterium]